MTVEHFRKGIAMIELIFALVIMGITLMSAPMLISQASNSSNIAFKQEAIAIIASHTNALLTYAWDEENTASRVNFEYTILRVADGNPSLADGNRILPGVRKFDISPLAMATQKIGNDTNASTQEIINDDVDDFVDNNITINPATATITNVNDGDFIDKTVKLTTIVNYIQEKNIAFTTNSIVYNLPKPTQVQTSNIKHITTRITSNVNDLEKDIQLKAFMCNIGAARPLKRTGI